MGATAVKEDTRVSVEDDESSDVTKALDHVNSIVENITKAIGTSATASADASDDSDDDDDAESVEKALTFKGKGAMKAALREAGLKGAALQKALDSLSALDQAEKAKAKAPPFPFPPKKDEEKEKETKSDDAPAVTKSEDAPAAKADTGAETLDALAKAIATAKLLTPENIAKLKEHGDVLKMVLEGIPQGTNPSGMAPGGTSFGDSGVKDLTVKKSADAEILGALTGLTEVIKSLSERVEKVEKARPASNALSDEDTTDEPTQKGKSIWGGIVLG